MSTTILVLLTYAVAVEAGVEISPWFFWLLCFGAGLWDGLTIRSRMRERL